MTQPKYAKQDKNGRRYYTNPETGKRLPSVTTVLGMMSKPLLVPWAAKVTAQYAVDNWPRLGRLNRDKRIQEIKRAHDTIRNDSAELGDTIHEYAESYLKDEPTPQITDENVSAVGALFAWVDEYKPELLGAEVSVWNATYGYAGTFDLLAKINGETWLLDYKTGKGLYPEVAMQLAALGKGETILNEGLDKLPKIDHYGVVQVRTDQPVFDASGIPVLGSNGEQLVIPAFARMHEVGRVEESFKAFRACLDLYNWKKLEPEIFPSYTEFRKQADDDLKGMIESATPF